jgi:hypothetical protein
MKTPATIVVLFLILGCSGDNAKHQAVSPKIEVDNCRIVRSESGRMLTCEVLPTTDVSEGSRIQLQLYDGQGAQSASAMARVTKDSAGTLMIDVPISEDTEGFSVLGLRTD